MRHITLERVADGKCFILRGGSGTIALTPKERDYVFALLEESKRADAQKGTNGKTTPKSEPLPAPSLKKIAGGKRR